MMQVFSINFQAFDWLLYSLKIYVTRYYQQIFLKVSKHFFCKTHVVDGLRTLQTIFGFLTGKVHSHHPHKEIEDDDLENMLIKNYEDEEELLDEYNNNEDPELEDMDEQLADPRAYPHPKPKWPRVRGKITISFRIICAKFCDCVVKSFRCEYPPGCVCNKFGK